MTTAFIFPGQGSQKVGMIKALAESNSGVMAVLNLANKVLGRDLKKIMFEGPEEELRDTRNTQPALFASSMAAFALVEKEGWKADCMAGHSLGEYSALCAAGAITFEEGLRLVQERADAMAEAGSNSGGSMAAILGMEDEKIISMCKEISTEETVEPANFNCPGQVVISGHPDAVQKFIDGAKAAGAKRAMPLPVSGAFHSRYMKPAGDSMAEKLSGASWTNPRCPVYVNVSGLPVTVSDSLAANLEKQIFSPVLWTQSIQAMKAAGVDTYIEIGSGKILSGLVKKIDGEATLLNIEDPDSLEKCRQAMAQREFI